MADHDDKQSSIDKQSSLRLDKHGLPLQPQLSDSPDDPLNWPLYQRAYIAILLSILAFLSQFGSAVINSAYLPMAKELNVSVQRASYATTVYVLFSGVVPMFLIPLASVYGRRNLYLIGTLVAAVANIGSGAAKSYGGLIVGRCFYGVGAGIPLALGPATICDLFPISQRGFWLGLFVLLVNNGPHIAPVAGGFIALDLTWHWCFFIPGFITAGFWPILFFTFPETLYSRTDGNKITQRSYFRQLTSYGKVLDRQITGKSFLAPFYMAKYAAVVLPGIMFATSNSYGSILFAVTGARIANKLYKFDTAQTGLLMGIPLLIGSVIGESSSGWLSDFIMNAYAKRHNGLRKPEVRLWLLPLCLLLNAGVIGYGFAVEAHTRWLILAICMAIAGFGTQLGTTVVYTYVVDAYKPQSAEVGALLSLIKSLLDFNVGFYALPFSEKAGYDESFGVLAVVNAFTLIPVACLISYGEQIRQWQGEPNIHKDL